MDALPMAPSCTLDDAGLRSQLERYRRAGVGAKVVDEAKRRLVVELDQHVDNALVDEILAVERACCPFFTLRWEPDRRRLSLSVHEAEHEPALEAIALALGVRARPPHTH